VPQRHKELIRQYIVGLYESRGDNAKAAEWRSRGEKADGPGGKSEAK
jgi:hypothetical protein